jgi:hypothetical protein
MFANKAMRLVLEQEPNHDLLTGKRQPTEALAYPFDGPADPYSHRRAFIQGWNNAVRNPFKPAPNITGDDGALFNKSRNVLLAHEDKTADGAAGGFVDHPVGTDGPGPGCRLPHGLAA